MMRRRARPGYSPQALLGKPIPDPAAKAKQARVEREHLEWLAQISTEHEAQLRKLQSAEAEARHQRELLEWLAQISTEHAAKLRRLKVEEYEAQEAQQRWEHYYEDYSAPITEWNEVDHPRRGYGLHPGAWVGKGVGGSAAGSVERTAANPSDPSRWYLPSDAKGEWVGAKGHSTFRLKTPVKVNGKLVRDIEFTNGVPVLDKFALPGNTATIILTGDHDTDIIHAKEAWRNLNPGKELPKNATFHHDLLHATEQTVTIDGKKTKVLVGKMQLIPTEINSAVFHQGSASVAKKYYQGLGVDVRSVARLAKEEAGLAGRSRTVVSRALGKIKPGKIAKGLAPLVGRSIARVIPLVGTGLAVLEFADNVEAHGIGGAVARATPLLGDLISAYDAGSDLAKQIRDEADDAAGEHLRRLNEPVRKAWEEADQQTIAAFHELAPQIKVTNQPLSEGGEGLVDPQEIAQALNIYRNQMQQANHLRISKVKGFDYAAAATHNKQQLRQRLERASQKRGPAPRGPMA